MDDNSDDFSLYSAIFVCPETDRTVVDNKVLVRLESAPSLVSSHLILRLGNWAQPEKLLCGRLPSLRLSSMLSASKVTTTTAMEKNTLPTWLTTSNTLLTPAEVSSSHGSHCKPERQLIEILPSPSEPRNSWPTLWTSCCSAYRRSTGLKLLGR